MIWQSVKSHPLILAAIFVSAAFVFYTMVAGATSSDDIVFPISELGNCQDETSCRTYCEKSEHIRACISFAEEHDLWPNDELERAKKFVDVIENGGPGGYRTEEDIRKYCDDIAHIDECLAFVEKYDLLPSDELREAKQVAAALVQGAKLPDHCTNKKDCLDYCAKPAHTVECVSFAETAGFLTGEQAEEARKFAPLIVRGETPGRCATKADCKSYCDAPPHVAECLDFALKNDLVPPEDREEAAKLLPIIQQKGTPGGCTSKKSCEDYCNDTAHFNACIDFAEDAGLVSVEEAALARKAGGKGPGDCRSRQNCEAYCKDTAHRDECIQFGVRIGLIGQEEADQAKNLPEFTRCLVGADTRILACFTTHLGPQLFSQLQSGVLPWDTGLIEKVKRARECVSGYASQVAGEFERTLGNFPEMSACVDQQLGPGFVERLKSGTLRCGEAKGIQDKVLGCFDSAVNVKFEACTAKGSCAEFISCMAALKTQFPTSSPGTPTQEPPPGVKEKFEACKKELSIDDCFEKPTCIELSACVAAKRGPGAETSGGEEFGPTPEQDAKLKACGAEMERERLLACLPKPCAEFKSCLMAGSGGQSSGGGGSDQAPLPLEVQEKSTVCAKEEAHAKMLACFTQPCAQALACLGTIDTGTGSGGGTHDPDIEVKVQACVEELYGQGQH